MCRMGLEGGMEANNPTQTNTQIWVEVSTITKRSNYILPMCLFSFYAYKL